MEFDFEQDIQIDASALDIEILRQPTLFYKYSENESQKKRELAEAHEKIKTIRSVLIREAGGNKEIKNATQLEAYYRNNEEYQEAKQDHIEAEYEANMASNAVWAMNQRKSSLENLVKLALADYFARPVEPRDLQGEVDKLKNREEDTNISRGRAKRKMNNRRK